MVFIDGEECIYILDDWMPISMFNELSALLTNEIREISIVPYTETFECPICCEHKEQETSHGLQNPFNK